MGRFADPPDMPARLRQAPSAARVIRTRIDRGGERLWRLEDFRDLPTTAVAQALSRMARSGQIERLSKGTYYRARGTAFGKSRPNPVSIRQLAARSTPLFPSGTAAANMLGFTTQAARRTELSTTASSVPRKLVGADTVVHTRRPHTWIGLSEADAAFLDLLRHSARTSELPPGETRRRALALLSERGRFERLVGIAESEPPRVRAMLGALGEQLHQSQKALDRLRKSLNPLSRFDFGPFAGLPTARAWQAKEHHR